MSLPPLTIIPAGAGSGKTYMLQTQLGEWVSEGRVRPERIVAVTFTEAAASELKERIGAKLLELGRVEAAPRLEEAYASTIPGFGLRILTEFAFEAGSSPQPRLLNEHEQNALIRLALARTTATDEITENLDAYGYPQAARAHRCLREPAQAPEWFTTAPAPAIQKALDKAGWKASDVDLYEINEVFPVVTMASAKDLGLYMARVNANGGACALRHPTGATGARLVTTLGHALRKRGLKRGVASQCIGGGEATAIAVELLD